MATITTAKVTLLNKMNRVANKVGLGTLLNSYAGSHVVLAAGKHTTVGGDATESITVTGAASTDVAIVTMQTVGASPTTIVTALPATNAITVTLAADPAADHVLSYVVLRAVS
jgi:hypothetical protein